jgi:glycosyltransferase involved in cell wall biosynthesis
MNEVSLYVPCYNAAKYLDFVIPGICRQSYPIKELLIIDDGSTDETVKTAEKYKDNETTHLRIIKHETNKGLGAARNTAIMASKSEFIASLDADVVPDKEWLSTLMDELADNTVVGAGGCLIEKYSTTAPDQWRNTHMKQCWGESKMINPSWLFGSNNVFRRKELLDIGLYSEHCKTNGEDYEINERLKTLNFNIVFNPLAKCYHLRKDTLKSVMRTYWRYAYFGNWHAVSLEKTIYANFKNFFLALKVMKYDLKSKHIKNIIIDFILPFYSLYLDWNEFKKNI